MDHPFKSRSSGYTRVFRKIRRTQFLLLNCWTAPRECGGISQKGFIWLELTPSLGHSSQVKAGSILHMIQSFADKDTEELFNSEKNRRSNAIARVALRKLIQMNQARALFDLAVSARKPLGSSQGGSGGLSFHSHQRTVADRLPVDGFRPGAGCHR